MLGLQHTKRRFTLNSYRGNKVQEGPLHVREHVQRSVTSLLGDSLKKASLHCWGTLSKKRHFTVVEHDAGSLQIGDHAKRRVQSLWRQFLDF